MHSNASGWDNSFVLKQLERVHTIDNKEISDIMEPCR